MAAQADLWGELQVADLRTPVSILREQAALLGSKTGQLLEGRVDTEVLYGDWFSHSFNIVVPALENYTYGLFKVRHRIDLYPVMVDDGAELDTEAAFVEWLRQKLSSAETKRVISSLLAQARR